MGHGRERASGPWFETRATRAPHHEVLKKGFGALLTMRSGQIENARPSL
jgi:hypothetical protein